MPATITGLCSGASGIERFDLREQFIGNQRAFGEFLAAMHDAMRDQTDVRCAADDASLFGGEFGHHGLERVRKVAFRQVALHLALRAAVREFRAINADALDLTARLARLVRGVVEAVLER